MEEWILLNFPPEEIKRIFWQLLLGLRKINVLADYSSQSNKILGFHSLETLEFARWSFLRLVFRDSNNQARVIILKIWHNHRPAGSHVAQQSPDQLQWFWIFLRGFHLHSVIKCFFFFFLNGTRKLFSTLGLLTAPDS